MRTWEENRAAINQLWPQCQWNDEERALWRGDLSGLDQDVLYDAARNVKRNKDTLYPQLKWFLDEYRDLSSAKRRISTRKTETEKKLNLKIDDEEDSRLHGEIVAVIDMAEPSQFEQIETLVLNRLPKMHAKTALRALMYARLRLLGQSHRFGKVDDNGDVLPISFGGSLK